MAASLGTLRVDLIANVAKFSDGLNRAEQVAQRRARNIRKAIRGIQGAAAGIGVSALIGGTVSRFAEFERGLVAVGKTADLEGQQLEDFGAQIQAIGLKVPIATSGLLEIAAAAAQVGVDGTDNILAFTETMARLQLATDVAGEEGAKSIARILNVTKEGTGNIEQFGNVLTALGNNAAASESEILALATRIAQSTATYGVSSGEALALGAAYRSVGQDAEVVGSTLLESFRVITKAIGEGGKDLELLASIAGVTADEFKKQFGESTTKAFTLFQVGLGRVVKESSSLEEGVNKVNKALEQLGLSGKRPSSVLLSLAGNTEVLTDSFKTFEDELKANDALFNESIKSAKTFSGQMQLLGNSADGAAVAIGKLIAPAALAAVQGLAQGAQVLADNVIYLKDAAIIAASVIAGRTVASIVGFTSAINLSNVAINLAAIASGRLSLALVLLNARLGAAAIAARAFNAAMAFFGGPIGALIAAVGAAYLIVSNHTKDATRSTKEYTDALEYANSVGETATETLNRRTEAMDALHRGNLEAKSSTQRLALAEAELNLDRLKNQRGGGALAMRAVITGTNAAIERVRVLREQLFETESALTNLDRRGTTDDKGESPPKPPPLFDDKATKKKFKTFQDITAELILQRDRIEANIRGNEKEFEITQAILEARREMGRELSSGESQTIRNLMEEANALEQFGKTAREELNRMIDAERAVAAEGKALAESVRLPWEIAEDKIKRINELLEAGALGEGLKGVQVAGRATKAALEESAAALDAMTPKAEEVTNEMTKFAEQAAANMQDSFAQFLFDPFDKGVKGMLDSFTMTLRKMAAEIAAAQILKGSGIESFLTAGVGALFGGGGGGTLPPVIDKGIPFVPRAMGGVLAAGQLALVGEREPELFVPKTAGNVISNDQMGGNTVTVNITAPPSTGQQSATQFGYEIGRSIQTALRRNG